MAEANETILEVNLNALERIIIILNLNFKKEQNF